MGGGDTSEDEEDDRGVGNSAEERSKRAAEAGVRPPIYNAEGMHEKLEDIAWPSEVSASSCYACIFSRVETSSIKWNSASHSRPTDSCNERPLPEGGLPALEPVEPCVRTLPYFAKSLR
jgi:hypothetical protein